MAEYAGLLGRACPAAVYEYADAEGSEADAAGKKFVINSQVRRSSLYILISKLTYRTVFTYVSVELM